MPHLDAELNGDQHYHSSVNGDAYDLKTASVAINIDRQAAKYSLSNEEQTYAQ